MIFCLIISSYFYLNFFIATSFAAYTALDCTTTARRLNYRIADDILLAWLQVPRLPNCIATYYLFLKILFGSYT